MKVDVCVSTDMAAKSSPLPPGEACLSPALLVTWFDQQDAVAGNLRHCGTSSYDVQTHALGPLSTGEGSQATYKGGHLQVEGD